MAWPALPITPEIDVMLTIRPARWRSIGRSTALVTRKADLRLVSSTASQSSSDMRMISVSRVIPALLTRTSMRLKRVQRGLDQALDVGGHRDVGLDDGDLAADRLRACGNLRRPPRRWRGS